MKGYLHFMLYLAAGAAFTGSLSSCRREAPASGTAPLVKTTTVRAHNGDYSVTYPGMLKAATDVKLSFRVAGPIHKVWVEEGQHVKKGTLLAQLDPRDYTLQYEAAEARYKQVMGETERIMELYKTRSVSENEYDKAVAARKEAGALYHARQNALEDTRLKAPFDGYIQKKYFNSDELVNTGTPVLSMINDQYLEVETAIPAADFIHRRDFREYRMKADLYPDTLFALELLEINRQANVNQLFQARFRLKKGKEVPLAPGMSAGVTIRYRPGTEKLSLLPVSALLQEEGRSYVWRVESAERKTVRKIPVNVQQVTKEGTAVVHGGLQAGDTVVSAGVHTLKEGQEIRVLPPVAASNIGRLL